MMFDEQIFENPKNFRQRQLPTLSNLLRCCVKLNNENNFGVTLSFYGSKVIWREGIYDNFEIKLEEKTPFFQRLLFLTVASVIFQDFMFK